MITLNGNEIEDASGLNVTQLLTRENYPTKLIAVECNGMIVPRSNFEHHCFCDGDIIEVVRFVGGG